MSKYVALALFCLFLSVPSVAFGVNHSALRDRVQGRILLDVEQNGEAWYVSPDTQSRYYLGRPDDAFRLMRQLGLGITDADLMRIRVTGSTEQQDALLSRRLAGRIVLQVEQHGEAWYVDPVSLERVYLGRPEDAFAVMSSYGLGVSSSNLAALQMAPPPGLKVAFLGDQGVTPAAKSLLRMLDREEVDVIVHMGDLGYDQSSGMANAWKAMIRSFVDDDVPYLVSVGNHDVSEWATYASFLQERNAAVPGLSCSGELGVNEACLYQGVLVANSGIGTMGENHEERLRAHLSSEDVFWKICSWHKNQRLLQVGGKQDETGWGVYEACRKAGAIVATGHEHSYSRTYEMANFDPPTLEHTQSVVTLRPNRTFAFVSGLGGKSIRSEKDDLASHPWWASVSTKDRGADYGALICTLHENQDEREGSCAFTEIGGRIVDQFSLRSELVGVE